MACALINSLGPALFWEGEGFVPGETVNFVFNGGVVTSGTANTDGGIAFNVGFSSFNAASVHLDGTVSGRRAWLAARADTRAPLVPSLIVSPSQVWGEWLGNRLVYPVCPQSIGYHVRRRSVYWLCRDRWRRQWLRVPSTPHERIGTLHFTGGGQRAGSCRPYDIAHSCFHLYPHCY